MGEGIVGFLVRHGDEKDISPKSLAATIERLHVATQKLLVAPAMVKHSPADRARLTAEIIAAVYNVPAVVDPRLAMLYDQNSEIPIRGLFAEGPSGIVLVGHLNHLQKYMLSVFNRKISADYGAFIAVRGLPENPVLASQHGIRLV